MCTRIFWSDHPVARVAARTMDWNCSDEPELWVLPRGRERDGQLDDQAATWRSRFASVCLSAWQHGVTDGLNEAGLGVHLLYLEATEYEQPDARPGVSLLVAVSFLLDTCATVVEALAALATVRIVPREIRGRVLGAHLAIEDAAGDSAVIEFLAGRLHVHHGSEFAVMANDPPFDRQLELARAYVPVGDQPLPGDILSTDRFLRARYFLHYLPEPADQLQAIAGILSVAGTVAVPFGAPYGDEGIYPTWWTSVADVTNRVYCFRASLSPNLVWIDLAGLDLAALTEPLQVDITDATLVGELSPHLAPATPGF